MVVFDDAVCRQNLQTFLSAIAPHSEQPFVLVFRPTGDEAEDRMSKTREALALIHDARSKIPVTFAVALDLRQIPLVDRDAFLNETREHLSLLAGLGVPLIPMVSVTCAPETASDILMHAQADALFVSDSLGWYEMPERARKVFFRRTRSPLPGGIESRISGKYLLPLTVEWIRQLKRSLALKPIIAGGGVLRRRDADALKEAGATGFAVTSALRRLRPWNVWRVIRHAHKVFVR